ncbi:MAG: DoxX family protein [Betaproteobacteria bacterium]|nr:DoxX family protein [Betaproteobacteria bacterium]
MSSVAPTAPGNQPAILLVGRILMAALFLNAGLRKAFAYSATVGYFTKLGFPMPEAMAVIAPIIEIGGAVMLIVGWKTRYAAWLLALFTLIAACAAHRFWTFDAAQVANQMNHFMKNVAIIGGLLFIAAFGPGRLSVEKG